jgi:nicotinamidase-related amidase
MRIIANLAALKRAQRHYGMLVIDFTVAEFDGS